MDGAIPEQCRRRSENKIGSPLYIAVQKIEPGAFRTGINSILISQKAAVDKNQAVAFRMKRNSLPQSRSIILNRQVLKSNGVSLYFQSVSTESPHFVYIGMIIVSDYCIFRIFTDEIDIFQPRRKNNLLLIYTFFNQYCHFIIHKGPDALHGFGQRAVIPATVTCHNNRVFPLLCRRQGTAPTKQSYHKAAQYFHTCFHYYSD